MSDTLSDWLPSLPEGWQVRPFYSLFSERVQPNEGRESCVLSLSYGEIVERDIESNYGLLPASFDGYNIVEPNDIVMRLTDMQNDQRSLRTGQVQTRGIITSAYVTVTPGQEMLPRFAHYLLHGYDLAKVFYRMGGGLRQSMKFADLKRLPLVLPPVHVQERVADYLDEQTARIDALIAEKELLLERLQEYSTAHANEVFRNRLTARGGVRLKYRCPQVTVGIVVTPAKYYVEAGVPCLRSLNVGEGYLIAENLVHISPEANELHGKSKIYVGDIVVVRSGKTGAAAVVTPEFDGTNCIDLVIIRSSPQVDSEWLRVYLNSAPALEQVTDASEGAIQQHFNVGSARELRIPDSPLDEQRRDLAEVLRVERATTELAAHVKMHLERLREYRSSLISAAVTGQLQVQGIARGA